MDQLNTSRTDMRVRYTNERKTFRTPMYLLILIFVVEFSTLVEGILDVYYLNNERIKIEQTSPHYIG